MAFKPRFISFDCYGTLINFEMAPTARRLFKDRVPADRMPAFLDSFGAYRLDEVLGDWKPFLEVVQNSIQRACKAHGIDCRPSDAAALYDAIASWQPHPNVVEVLEAIAPHVPLVILSNSMVDLIPASVAHLKAKFHAVYTAEQARAYKPRVVPDVRARTRHHHRTELPAVCRMARDGLRYPGSPSVPQLALEMPAGSQ